MPERFVPPERVSELSEEYQRERAVEREYHPHSFATFFLELVHSYDEVIARGGEEAERARKQVQKTIESVRQYLRKRHQDNSSRLALLSFYARGLKDEAVGEAMSSFVESSTRTLDQLVAAELPDNVVVYLLEKHEEAFQQAVVEFQQQEEQLRSEFLDRVRTAIERGDLPLSADEVERRVTQSPARLRDHFSSLRDVNGAFEPESGEVFIASDISGDELRHTYFHEYVHVLSGRTILKGKPKSWDIRSIFHEDEAVFQHQRIGLRFQSEVSGTPHARFRWLNEAVTERIAMELLGISDEDGYYLTERVQLAAMEKMGTAFPLIKRAYFENYDADSSGEHIPAWKELSRQLLSVHDWKKFLDFDNRH